MNPEIHSSIQTEAVECFPTHTAHEFRVIPVQLNGRELVLVPEKDLSDEQLKTIAFVINRPVKIADVRDFADVRANFTEILYDLFPKIVFPEFCSASTDIAYAERLLDLGLISPAQAEVVCEEGILAMSKFFPSDQILRLLSVVEDG